MDNLLNFSQTSDSLTLYMVIVNLALAFTLSLAVASIYRKTHKGLSYSQSFTFTLILIGFLIAVIIMVIGNSLIIAIGAFGAFSLIRFRTAIKDSKDIAFILLVVAIGLAVGTANYSIAIVTTIFAISVIYILTRINFGSIRKYDYVLNFSVYPERFSNEIMRRVFDELLKSDNLLNVAARENGKVIDYSFNVEFIKSSNIGNFVNKLNKVDGIYNIDLISAKNDIEY